MRDKESLQALASEGSQTDGQKTAKRKKKSPGGLQPGSFLKALPESGLPLSMFSYEKTSCFPSFLMEIFFPLELHRGALFTFTE